MSGGARWDAQRGLGELNVTSFSVYCKCNANGESKIPNVASLLKITNLEFIRLMNQTWISQSSQVGVYFEDKSQEVTSFPMFESDSALTVMAKKVLNFISCIV